MNNPTHDAVSVREMQQLAVSALDELLSLDLPELIWHLSAFMRKPKLEGQVPADVPDAESRDIVRRWSAALKAEYTEQRNRRDTFTTVHAVGEFENVTVTVWTHVDEADE